MCKTPEQYMIKLSALLPRINKMLRLNTVKSEYTLRAVNMDRAKKFYNMINIDQRNLLLLLAQDLISSKEFVIEDILIYSVLFNYNKNDDWIFDNDDYYSLKKNIKKINKMFRSKTYISILQTIVSDLESGKYSGNDLARINSDGESILYKMYISGDYPLQVLVKIQQLFTNLDVSRESEDHRRFRKMLVMIKNILK